MNTKIIAAKTPLTFRIKNCDVTKAKPGDKNHCVIANSLTRELSELIQYVSVGSKVTKVYTAKGMIKYKTPHVLGSRLGTFDQTGKWDLPCQEYELLPYPVNPNPDKSRSKRDGYTTSKTKIFKGRRIHSRFVTITS